MTLALHCRRCGAVRSFPVQGATIDCDCPTDPVYGWYVDEAHGIGRLHVNDVAHRENAEMISLHGGVLHDWRSQIPQGYTSPDGKTVPFPAATTDTAWRNLHDRATIVPRAPETVAIFGKSHRACWAVIIEPGSTPDTAWASESELKLAGLHE